MSKRRRPGDIVVLNSDSYDGGKGLRVKILPNYQDEEGLSCMNCEDPKCVEWATVEVVDDNDNGTGRLLYHYDEHQMDDPA
jgi:hypothetical protein